MERRNLLFRRCGSAFLALSAFALEESASCAPGAGMQQLARAGLGARGYDGRDVVRRDEGYRDGSGRDRQDARGRGGDEDATSHFSMRPVGAVCRSADGAERLPADLDRLLVANAVL